MGAGRQWFRLLRPNGTLILRTPDNESWRSMLSLLFRGHYALSQSSSCPVHITPLLRCDIERCLTEAGFENPVFSFTDYGTLPRFPKLRHGVLKGCDLATISWQSHQSETNPRRLAQTAEHGAGYIPFARFLPTAFSLSSSRYETDLEPRGKLRLA